jgi:antitoxin VapB
MPRIGSIFLSGRSQAVRLSANYSFQGSQVYIRRDFATGDVILGTARRVKWRGPAEPFGQPECCAAIQPGQSANF